MTPDYSTYRLQLKSLKSDLDEKQIYQMYNGVMRPGRSTQTTPYLAEDGLYHCIYLTECLDDGRIYIGKHSTSDLGDGYQGSGYEIADGKVMGKKFKTTVLEFFDSSDQAYVAEKGLVNVNFIRNQKLVMNHVLGGKSHVDGSSADKDESAKPAIQNPDRSTSSVRRKASTFSDLNVPFGDFITVDEDPTIKFKVVDDWNVLGPGSKIMKLGPALRGLSLKEAYKNPLNAVSYKGRNLGEIQKELKDGKKAAL
jgi:hypothetical protein